MAFRSIEEFERILADIPPAARHLDLSWKHAKTWEDWFEIRVRMTSAAHAVEPYNADDADAYRMLAEIAKERADRAYARRLAELVVTKAMEVKA